MTTPSEREIATSGSPIVPFDFLQSIFIAELIYPSRHLWIVSPWISDVEVIDNRARQFSTLCPDWPATRIRLSRVIETVLERGARVTVAVNESQVNDEFASRLRQIGVPFGKGLRIIRAAHLHEKGIVGDSFSLSGSMNLTFNGVYVNDEYVVYTCDLKRVAERRVNLESRLGDGF